MSTKHRAQTRRDKRPAKKRTRRIKVEVGPVVEDRRKALGLPSFFEDKKRLAQARRVIETRGVSRQQERNTLYAYQAYTVLEGAKGAGLDPRYRFLWDERGAEQDVVGKKADAAGRIGTSWGRQEDSGRGEGALRVSAQHNRRGDRHSSSPHRTSGVVVANEDPRPRRART